MSKRNLVGLVLVTLAATLALGSCSSAGRSMARPEPQSPDLPALPLSGAGGAGHAKRTSSHQYTVDVTAPAGQAGNNNRVDAPGYILASTAGPAWAMYSVTMTDDQRPVALDLQAAAAPVISGGSPAALNYWVAISNYSTLNWEWKGPFTDNTTIPLNDDPPSSPSARRVDSGTTFYFVVVAGRPDNNALSANALKVNGAVVDTELTYKATVPHAVVCGAVQGNDKGPASPFDAHSITVEWTNVDAQSPQDAQNVADTYKIYRRGAIGDYKLLGSVNYPENKFLDPVDITTGVNPPQPGMAYSYYVTATNEQGSSLSGNHCSALCPNPDNASIWNEYRANPQRTGSVGSVTLSGTLSKEWDVPLSPAAGQNTYEPMVADNGDLLIVNGSHVNRYAFSDGSENFEAGSYGPQKNFAYAARAGNLLAFPDETTGVQTVNLSGGASKHFAGTGSVSSAPLLIGNFCIFADTGGAVSCYDSSTSSLVWQHIGMQPFHLAPATDYQYVYAVDDAGSLLQLRITDGSVNRQLELGINPVGESLALDTARHMLWLVTQNAALVAISTDTLTVGKVWPSVGGNTGVAPCVLPYTTPPMVVTAYDEGSDIMVLAVDASSFDTLWSNPITGTRPNSISASADELLVCHDTFTGSVIDTISLTGSDLQSVPLPADFGGSAVPTQGKLAVALLNDPHLQLYKSETLTPPVWQDPNEVGIFNWEISGVNHDERDDIKAVWGTATHPDNLTVHYALFYSVGHAPMLDAPYTDTTVVSGLTIADSNTVFLTDQPLGQRLYASVRAYIGTWGVDALTDSNTNVLGCTPPWQERVLYTTSSALPSGSTSQFAVVPSDINRDYFITTANPSGQLWCEFESVGGFDYEGAWINSYGGAAVAASWYNGLFYAARAKPGLLSVFQRNSKNDWTLLDLTGRDPDPSPAVSLSMNDQSAIAWTQKISGSEPSTVVNYYAARDTGSGWGASEVVDATNAGGSDLSLVLNPADHSKPWIAYERGTQQAGTLPTCTKGELWYASGDGAGGYGLELVDAGANSPSSDCGKRVKQVLDSSGYPHLVYLDLNASNTEPRGRLKYAYKDGSGWHIENVANIDLSHQTGDTQFTYGQIGFMLDNDQPVIALLERQDYDPSAVVYNHIIPRIFTKTGNSWTSEQVADAEPVLLKDHEPCEVVPDGSGNYDLYYIGQPAQNTGTPGTQMVRQIHIN